MNENVLVIGGGVVGLSVAWELSRRGVQVTVLERGQIGKATSWAAAGILPPANLAFATDPIDRLRGFSHQLFPRWVDQLQSITSIDPGFRRCGGWYLADTAGERASLGAMTAYWEELGIECQPMSVAALAEREPATAAWAARTAGAAAWWIPEEWQLRPPRYLQALHQACLAGGVSLLEQAAVEDIRDTDGSPAVLANGHWHAADAMVVCGGAWTGKIAPALQLDRSLIPIRGQILLLKTPSPLLSSIVNVGQRYVMCRDDGSTLVGSCEEEVGFECGTSEEVLSMLSEFAGKLVPELAAAPQVAAWSGLRPLTFDGFPMIGKAPGTTAVFVAAGHFRSGLHLSPGTAVALADLMLGQRPAIDLTA